MGKYEAMANENLKSGEVKPGKTNGGTNEALDASFVRPAWVAFVRYCQELGHGEIKCLKIQDGVPVLAKVTKRKVKFT